MCHNKLQSFFLQGYYCCILLLYKGRWTISCKKKISGGRFPIVSGFWWKRKISDGNLGYRRIISGSGEIPNIRKNYPKSGNSRECYQKLFQVFLDPEVESDWI
jgi:hypothetical protein